ncbi:DUF302 domain-containing protein [Nocardia sp. NPDC050412]|uniref:DUF302 domain-containing protein n=1 Tax=unclassified Nocardia TaxID=2637762 RepID=UPI003798CD23
MPYRILIDEASPQTVLELRRAIRADHAGDDIDAGMRALYELATTTGLAPVGSPSTTYLGDLRADTSTEVDFDLPVTIGPIGDNGDQAMVRRTEPGLFARTTHRGDYQHIGDAYRALENWLRTSSFQPVGPPTEVYLVAPDEVVDARDLVTEIRIPVAPAELLVRVPTPFADTVAIVRAALAEQGFGVLTEIDVRATLRVKLDVDMEDYLILGACNPQLAHRALDIHREIGLLLPCNVVVRTHNDATVVEVVDPDILVVHTRQPALRPIAREARAGLAAALDAIVKRCTASA